MPNASAFDAVHLTLHVPMLGAKNISVYAIEQFLHSYAEHERDIEVARQGGWTGEPVSMLDLVDGAIRSVIAHDFFRRTEMTAVMLRAGLEAMVGWRCENDLKHAAISGHTVVTTVPGVARGEINVGEGVVRLPSSGMRGSSVKNRPFRLLLVRRSLLRPRKLASTKLSR